LRLVVVFDCKSDVYPSFLKRVAPTFFTRHVRPSFQDGVAPPSSNVERGPNTRENHFSEHDNLDDGTLENDISKLFFKKGSSSTFS
jgi:hypothetical protein